jgi:hypothetical protein
LGTEETAMCEQDVKVTIIELTASGYTGDLTIGQAKELMTKSWHYAKDKCSQLYAESGDNLSEPLATYNIVRRGLHRVMKRPHLLGQ